MQNMELKKLMNNAHVITMVSGDDTFEIITSYESIILVVKNGMIETVGKDWNYGTTTAKHLNAGLRYIGLTELASMNATQKKEYFKNEGMV